MINDNILADRLNLYREGKLEEAPEGEFNEQIDTKISNFLAIIFKAIEMGGSLLRSLAFGYAVKTVFDTNWNFTQFFVIGFVIEIILTNIFDLFKQKNI